MKIFEPSDFYDFDEQKATTPGQAAIKANEKLNAMIESWPVVYNSLDHVGVSKYAWSSNRTSNDTHKARLAFVETLSPEKSSAQKICDVLNEHLTDQDRKSLAHFCKLLEGIGGSK